MSLAVGIGAVYKTCKGKISEIKTKPKPFNKTVGIFTPVLQRAESGLQILHHLPRKCFEGGKCPEHAAWAVWNIWFTPCNSGLGSIFLIKEYFVQTWCNQHLCKLGTLKGFFLRINHSKYLFLINSFLSTIIIIWCKNRLGQVCFKRKKRILCSSSVKGKRWFQHWSKWNGRL